MKEQNKTNFDVQFRISMTFATIGLLTSLNAFLVRFFLKDLSLIDSIIGTPSVYLVFAFAVLFLATCRLKRYIIQYIQITVILLNAYIAIWDAPENFYGMGFIILAVLLAYKYGFLNTYIGIKLGSLIVSLIVLFELASREANALDLGSGIPMVLYLIFFLIMLYFIYTSELNRILKFEKAYNRNLLTMEIEKQKLMSEIESYKIKALNTEDRLQKLEHEISLKRDQGEALDLKGEYKITPRELEVIQEFCLNPHLTTKELAANLHMSISTIKQHFSSIFRKMKVRSRSELLDKCKWNFAEAPEKPTSPI